MRRGQFEHRRGAAPGRGRPRRSEDVPVPRGDDGVGDRLAHGLGGPKVRCNPRAGQDPGQRGGQARPVGGHEADGLAHALGRRVVGRRGRRTGILIAVPVGVRVGVLEEDQTQGAAVLVAHVGDGPGGGVGPRDEDGPGKFAEQRGDGVLPAALDAYRLAQGPQNTGQVRPG